MIYAICVNKIDGELCSIVCGVVKILVCVVMRKAIVINIFFDVIEPWNM